MTMHNKQWFENNISLMAMTMKAEYVNDQTIIMGILWQTDILFDQGKIRWGNLNAAIIVEHWFEVFLETVETLKLTMTLIRSRKSAATDYTQMLWSFTVVSCSF